MKIKKLVKPLIAALTLCLLTMPLTGCGFFGGDEGTAISEIKTEVNEDGETVVTIIYTDEEREPVEFIIPPGQDGIIGVGIDDIVASEVDENGNITLTIIYTDEEKDPVTVTVPVLKGEDGIDGISIEAITPTYNDDGSVTLTITYKDDRLPEQFIEIPAPEKGEDGKGIIHIEDVPNEDGSKTLIIYYTDDTTKEVFIPAPEKGEEGRGINYMLTEENDTQYKIIIYYTDGTDDTLTFSKPTQPNTWHSGYQDPNTISIGNNGDFYLDKTTMTVYQKNGSRWVEIATLQESKQTHIVTFNANGGIFGGDVISPYYELTHGYSFYSTPGYNLPSVSKEGFTFLGWYTSPIVGNVNSGHFTDLTPVLSDMTLYAWWE